MKHIAYIILILLTGTSFSIADEAVNTLLDARIELATLRQCYSEKHPKIVEAEDRVAALSTASISPKEYFARVHQLTDDLKHEDVRLAARYADKHPKRIEIAAKLSALQKESQRSFAEAKP